MKKRQIVFIIAIVLIIIIIGLTVKDNNHPLNEDDGDGAGLTKQKVLNLVDAELNKYCDSLQAVSDYRYYELNERSYCPTCSKTRRNTYEIQQEGNLFIVNVKINLIFGGRNTYTGVTDGIFKVDLENEQVSEYSVINETCK